MTARVDGRHARATRTRAAIVHAVLDLVSTRGVAPTGAEIAARAKVALRSIGQHFRSREELLLAAAQEHMRHARDENGVQDGDEPLASRARTFCEHRARELEATAGVRRASARFESASPSIAGAFAQVARARRRATAQAFAPELRELSSARRAETLDLLDIATCARAWDAMRRDQGLAAQAAARRMERLVRAILADGTRK